MAESSLVHVCVSSIPSFVQYFLSTRSVPGIELGPGNTAENQTDRSKRASVPLALQVLLEPVMSELELQLWPGLAL